MIYLIIIEKTNGRKEYRVAERLSDAKVTVAEWEQDTMEQNECCRKIKWMLPIYKSVSMREITLHELNGILRNVEF